MADRLIVKAQVDETDLGKVRVGLPCQVKLDAYPEEKMRGRVDHVAYEARNVNNVTVYDIEVALYGSGRTTRSGIVLRSGMTATVSVIVAERERVLIVPAEALTERDGVLGVLVPRPGTAPPTLLPVTLGLADGGRVEITAGLKEGSTVVISSNPIPPSKMSDAKNPFMPSRMQNRGGGGQRGGGGGGRR